MGGGNQWKLVGQDYWHVLESNAHWKRWTASVLALHHGAPPPHIRKWHKDILVTVLSLLSNVLIVEISVLTQQHLDTIFLTELFK